MPARRPITFLIALAYLLGFAAGFLVLGNLSKLEDFAWLKVLLGGHQGEAERAKISNKPAREPHDPVLLPTPYIFPIGATRVGEELKVVVKTQPGTVCTIWYTLPDMNDQNVPGDHYRVAGADGLCVWRWRIDPATLPGNANITVATSSTKNSTAFQIEP